MHLATVHRKERGFVCTLCNPPRKFSRAGGLQLHIRVKHHQEKPHACPACERRFSQKSHLVVHIRSAHSEIAQTLVRYIDHQDDEDSLGGRPQFQCLAPGCGQSFDDVSIMHGQISQPGLEHKSVPSGLTDPIAIQAIGVHGHRGQGVGGGRKNKGVPNLEMAAAAQQQAKQHLVGDIVQEAREKAELARHDRLQREQDQADKELQAREHYSRADEEA